MQSSPHQDATSHTNSAEQNSSPPRCARIVWPLGMVGLYRPINRDGAIGLVVQHRTALHDFRLRAGPASGSTAPHRGEKSRTNEADLIWQGCYCRSNTPCDRLPRRRASISLGEHWIICYLLSQSIVVSFMKTVLSAHFFNLNAWVCDRFQNSSGTDVVEWVKRPPVFLLLTTAVELNISLLLTSTERWLLN
jgi:hypothetical protein